MEIIASGTNTASGTSFVSVSELQTGSHVLTFKQTACSSNASTRLGDSVIIAQNDKALVNVYRWHKEGIDQKIVVPEKLDTLSASPDGIWLLGGSGTGRIYLWEIASGNLLFVREAHYQAITSCTFTHDNLAFVTASADATVQVWRLADVLDPHANQELLRPWKSFTQHTMPVTAVVAGATSITSSRLYTASLDQTIRIWDLATSELLSTLLLPAAINTIAIDSGERYVYAGTDAGLIYEIVLYKQETTVQVIGASGAIINAHQSASSTFEGHDSSITALALGLDGSTLVSGSQSGEVFVWNVSTKQMIRKLKQHPSAVTLLFTYVRQMSAPTTTKANNALQPLKRTQTERDRDEHVIHCKINTSLCKTKFQPATDLKAVDLGLAQIISASHDPIASEAIHKLQDELRKLYGSYSELRVKHEQLNKEYVSSQI